MGAVLGAQIAAERRDVAAAIADGIGSAKGGRVAAETAVRGFLDGFWDVPETMEVRRAGARILEFAERLDPRAGAAGREPGGHGLHVHRVGAARATGACAACRRYAGLSAERRPPAAADHRPCARRPREIARAVPARWASRRSCGWTTPVIRSRCTTASCCAPTGCTAALVDETIADILRVRSAPEDTSRALVEAALEAGSTDNCTALVLDVVALPTARSEDVGGAIRRLPLIPVPQVGDTVDGFVLNVLVSDGRYSRLFGAIDEVDGGTVVLKFPKPQVAAVETLPRCLRPRGLGRHAGHQPLGGACDRAAAGTADLPLHGDAAVRWGAAGNTAGRAPAVGLEQGRASRSGWRTPRRLCTAPASSTATSSRTT